MWALIYIQLVFPTPGTFDVDAQMYSTYKTVNRCFEAREELLLEKGRVDGYPKVNTQVVCVRLDNKVKS